jgi:thioesterase domain-containing protein
MPDGNIEHLGRTDLQVKIRGFRIELGEIESALCEHPDVKRAIIVMREDEAGTQQLLAYIVASEGRTLKTKDLRNYLRQKLPQYMMPSAFVSLDSLPLLPNGKIDRRALLTVGQVDRETESEYLLPRNDLEAQLVQIWREVLGSPKIGIRQDFFEIGGHSLLIPVMLAHIERTVGKKLSPAAIFQAPTIEQLAALLRTQSTQLVQVMPIQPMGTKPPFFCICVAAGPLLRDLALELGNDQPFLGLGFDPSALDQLATPYNLEDIAAHLVRVIRQKQPEGPYLVGGFCLNGLIAFETARQLQAQGQQVALLALFEAMNPAYNDRFSQLSQLKAIAELFRFRLLKEHLVKVSKLGARQAKSYIQSRLPDIRKDVRHLLWTSLVELRRTLGGERLPDLQQVLYVAARSYRPTPYSGRALYFRCTDRRATPASQLEKGWSGVLVGAFELFVLEGDHLGILVEPSLHLLVARLRTALLEAGTANEHEWELAKP